MSIIYFVDTETTGLSYTSGHVIIEFCCVKHVDRKEVDRISFKVIPTAEDMRMADDKALSINKYNAEQWQREGISQHLAAKKIADFMIGSKAASIVAHNVRFDVGMIKALLKKTGTDHRLPYRVIDSVAVAYARFEPFGLRSFRMDAIRDWLGWISPDAHTAEQDVNDLIKLWDILSPTAINDEDVAVKTIIVNRRIHG